LNAVLARKGRVFLDGAAATTLAGKSVKILLDGKRQVATATVGANGLFSASAPMPPARLRNTNGARYMAVLGKLHSLNLKLTRRLVLEPLKAAGGTVTLVGQVLPPLSRPLTPVIVYRELACGRTSIAMRFTPTASGRFHLSFRAPAGAEASIYRLASIVRESPHAKRAFATYSLPLPVILG
jgi:hypothetical protein